MAEVFISYSQKDRALVAPIAARLAELGVDAWYDREISAGERFGAVIRARLKEAKAVLACWSPEAIQSDWVEAEADYARELGTYLPVFVAPWALMPPFNRIHTDDLSKWTGEANDPTWMKLVDRIAKVIDREGVAEAARAFASGDEQARYDFARRYPDEPTARKIWSAAEARHRESFKQRMADARARINAESAAVEASLKEAPLAFDRWLADERVGAERATMPDPLDLIDRALHGEERRLREEIDELRSAVKTNEGFLGEANRQIGRLSTELTVAQRARKRDLEELAALRSAKTETAKADFARLSEGRAAPKRPTRERLVVLRKLFHLQSGSPTEQEQSVGTDEGMPPLNVAVVDQRQTEEENSRTPKPRTDEPYKYFLAGGLILSGAILLLSFFTFMATAQGAWFIVSVVSALIIFAFYRKIQDVRRSIVT